MIGRGNYHFILDTEKTKINKTVLLKEIQIVKNQLLEGVGVSLLSKAEWSTADRFLVMKNTRGGLKISLNDEAIMKETQFYEFCVLVSNEKMDAFSALREYHLHKKTEEGFRIDKQHNDLHVTRAKSSESLDGRFFCQYIANGYELFFQKELNRVKNSLAVPNEDPAHDKPDFFKKEKALLNWLKACLS